MTKKNGVLANKFKQLSQMAGTWNGQERIKEKWVWMDRPVKTGLYAVGFHGK